MSAQPAPSPANPAAWTLRDEVAMRVLAAMIGRGGWVHRGCELKGAREYASTAYDFADHMLVAREA